MNLVSRHRSIRMAFIAAALARLACMPDEAIAQPKQTPADMLANVSVHAPDGFYDPPANIPNEPGKLLRSEPLKDVALPDGLRGWRLLYTTTVDDKTAATAVATVLAPLGSAKKQRPVILWEHGTTGLLQRCMPSLSSAPTRGIPAMNQIVEAGWIVIATDYSFAEKNGPHPYIIGEGEARAALDSVRAARQMPEFKLDRRTIVWGHSQGGHAALWTGIIARRYAPDVRIAGVAAIAPVADMAHLLSLNPDLDKRLGSYIALAYSRFYPDIKFEQAIRPEALATAHEIARLCGVLPPDDPKRIAALTASFDGAVLATSSNPALAARLAQNAANQPMSMPVLIMQGMKDGVVPPAATDAYVNARCSAGQRFDYWTFAALDHNTIVQPGTKIADPLISWTKERIAGKPQARGCARKFL
jgi:pimeloyl-ACP methyl ester carboxylesterase